MRRVGTSRRHLVDLLRQRPRLDPVAVDPPASGAVGRVDQLQALLHLVERGVLSAEEFERQVELLSRRPQRT